ncbi:stage II sporulation protein P [Pseudalkalibacillus caeni]|uniref:Stage II sporulation protein P n=2 Tax=Exobacillus caeni TaxID=2574798 RepID=A0A5R9F447_9BACL|nr:stage II sporulation protein P [Pseudalkalibacillus caeni]
MYGQPRERHLRTISFFIILGLIVLFIMVGFITSSESKYRLSSSMLHEWITSFSTEALVYTMGWENPYFTQVLPEGSEPPALSSVAFQFATSVKPGDIRSLLGRELPGFALYDSKILIAGEGTDYTNLPNESAPPVEELLKERKVAEEQLKVSDPQQPIAPPVQTTNGKKVVYIYHTHSWESFLPLLGLEGSKDTNKASDGKTNITLIGEKLGEELEKRGIGTQVDTTNIGSVLNNKGWDSYKSYDASRPIVQSAMGSNQDLQFFFDLHRDSFREKVTTATINNKSYARTFFVIGKENPHYEQNYQMATELHKALEKRYPGLSRGVIEKQGKGVNGVYNQDLSPNSLLIEIGGVDNSIEELNRTVVALAEVISDFYWQAQKVSAE